MEGSHPGARGGTPDSIRNTGLILGRIRPKLTTRILTTRIRNYYYYYYYYISCCSIGSSNPVEAGPEEETLEPTSGGGVDVGWTDELEERMAKPT